MGFFDVLTLNTAKRWVENYLYNLNETPDEAKNMENKVIDTMAVNIEIDAQVRIKTVYHVETLRKAHQKELATTVQTDSNGYYTNPEGKKYYSKSELQRRTGTQSWEDFTS